MSSELVVSIVRSYDLVYTPPMRMFSSKHTTLWPRLVSSFITVRPDAPAPITATDFLQSAVGTVSTLGAIVTRFGVLTAEQEVCDECDDSCFFGWCRRPCALGIVACSLPRVLSE